jgi:hypothetical protein
MTNLHTNNCDQLRGVRRCRGGRGLRTCNHELQEAMARIVILKTIIIARRGKRQHFIVALFNVTSVIHRATLFCAGSFMLPVSFLHRSGSSGT